MPVHLPTQQSYGSIIMEQFQLEQSQFEQWTQWYSKQDYLFRFSMGAGFTGISTLIGIISHAGILLTLISGYIFFVFDQFFRNEFLHQERLKNGLTTEISKLDNALSQTTQFIKQIETNIQQKITVLENKIQTNNDLLKTELTSLDQKNQKLTDMILQLEKTQQEMTNKNQQLLEFLTQNSKQIQDSQQSINQQAVQLQNLVEQHMNLNTHFSDDTKKLAQIISSFQTPSPTIKTIEKNITNFQKELTQDMLELKEMEENIKNFDLI